MIITFFTKINFETDMFQIAINYIFTVVTKYTTSHKLPLPLQHIDHIEEESLPCDIDRSLAGQVP